jgi:hypothetical protein
MKGTLSEVVSGLVKLERGFNEEWDDPITHYAPSECGSIIARSQERRVDAFLEEHETTPQEISRMVEERTTAKWAFFNLLYLLANE